MRPQACRARVENGVGFCRILLRRGARVHSRGVAVVEHPALVAVRVGRPSNAGRDLRQLQRSASASSPHSSRDDPPQDYGMRATIRINLSPSLMRRPSFCRRLGAVVPCRCRMALICDAGLPFLADRGGP